MLGDSAAEVVTLEAIISLLILNTYLRYGNSSFMLSEALFMQTKLFISLLQEEP